MVFIIFFFFVWPFAETYIAVDPLQPMLGAVTRRQILQVVHRRDVLRLGRSQEVILDWVGANDSWPRVVKVT